MRVTQNYMSMRYLSGIQNNLNSVSNNLSAVLKGRNLLDPEQDPVNYISALSLQTMLDQSAQFSRNASNVLSWVQNADNELQKGSDLLSKALNEYAIYGKNDSQSADSRKAIAKDVLSVIQQLTSIGNAYYNGRYLFAGYQTQTKPFQTAERQVSSVVSNINGADAALQKKYNDMPELKEGAYTAKVSVINGVASVQLFDKNNNKILIDTNGTDETAGKGNITSYTLTTEYKKGMVINTGTGVGIKLPDTDMEGRTLTTSFNYTPGDNIAYYGDNGVVTTKIGYSQDVDINVPGNNIFMETNRTLRGTVTNTVKGLPATSTTYFSSLDASNASIADSIKFSGTDHNGYKVGIAKLSAPSAVTFDMTQATESERSVTLKYADEDFKITLDQKGYKNTEEVIYELNRKLENAGLAGEISAVNDGDRVMFISSRSGDHVQLDLKGTVNNKLGFNDPTPATDEDFAYSAKGKDTVFEMGFNGYNKQVEIQYKNETSTGGKDNRAVFATGANSIYVNGVAMKFNVNAGDTAEDIQNSINSALKDNGFAFTITAKVEATADADHYNMTLKMHNVNYDDNTFMSAKITTADGVENYKTATARDDNYPLAPEKRLGDMLTFIENLYDNAVSASLVDGKLIVQDIRSGSSRLSFNMDEQNTGIGYGMLEQTVGISGKYTGTKDDKWTVNVAQQAADPLVPGDFDKFVIEVKDTNGNRVSIQSVRQDSYYGQEIEIGKGVSITLGQVTNSTSFSLDLKTASNVSFGDMNVIEEGSNVDTFRSLTNLYNALNLNIPKSGIAAPSAWGDKTLKSTANPYFEGTFRGNYNDLLNFSIQNTNNLSEMYIQSELKSSSALMKYALNTDIDFDLVVKDGNNIYTKNITINKNNIFDSVKSPTSGTQAARLSFTQSSNLTMYYQDGGTWKEAVVSVPAGNYANTASLVSAINTGSGLPAGITAADNGDGTISFSTSGTISNLNVSGEKDSPIGFDNFSPEQLVADKISNLISMDPDLSQLGARAYFNNGQLEIYSGSGTKEISINANNAGTAASLFGSVTTSQKTSPLEFSGNKVLDLSYFDTASGSWQSAQITVPADPSGKYADTDALATAVNNAITSAGLTNITAAANSGKLSFSSTGNVTNLAVSANMAASTADENETDAVLGFYKSASVNSITAAKTSKLSLSSTTTAQRTINFNYNDGTQKTASITIDAKDYESSADIVKEINSKLNAKGLNGTIKAELVNGDNISFVYDDSTVKSFHVSGDYESTLGFAKAGTEAQIKVTGSDGDLVSFYTINTANQIYHVTDGVFSGFDAGFLYATDSFTTAVGSGIEYEIPVLNQAQNQVINSLTAVGTRQNKIESAINFNATMTTTNETLKASYLGASAADQTAAYSQYQLSYQAYQQALQATAKIMNISLLDFLK